MLINVVIYRSDRECNSGAGVCGAGVTSSFRLFIPWTVLIMNIVFRSPESLGGLQGIRVKGEGVKFHTREPGRCLSIAAAVAGGAIVLALLLASFSLASTDSGIRGGGETSWCCCGCPPDRGAGRKCCCVPAGNGDPVAATDLPSSACDCSLGTSRDTDSAEFTVVPARKYPLPQGEFAFVLSSSAHPYRVFLSGQTFEDHFAEPPDPPPERNILS